MEFCVKFSCVENPRLIAYTTPILESRNRGRAKVQERREVDRRKHFRRESDRQMVVEALERRRVDADEDGHRKKLRRAIRHNCTAELDYEVVQQSGSSGTWKPTRHKITGRILDLSAEGAAVFTAQPLSMGQVSGLRIKVYDGRVIEAHAEVRWTQYKEKKKGYASGMKFVHLTPASATAIAEFLQELDETLGL